MPSYYYQGVYSNGEKVSGVVEAPTQADALVLIRQNCDTILSVKETRVRQSAKDFTLFKKVDPKSLAIVCQQFSIILKAGLPLVQAVDLVAGQCSDKVLAKLLRQASEDVSNGWSLSYSLSRRGRALPVAHFARTAVLAARSLAASVAHRARSRVPFSAGMDTATKIAMIATTNSISMRVKPRFSRRGGEKRSAIGPSSSMI